MPWEFSPIWVVSITPAMSKEPAALRTLVLSYAYWHGHFHGDASIVGQTVKVNKHQLTIIGVAPPEFRGTELFFAPAMWIPMVQQPMIEGYDVLKQRGNHNGFVVGRLKPGVTAAQATEDLNLLGAWLSKTYPGADDGLKFSLARPGLIGDMLGGPARAFMAGLMLLAGLILLAACANLGSLFAARAADGAKETALRLALGSRRGMILRQLLTEAVVVSLTGGALGLAGGVAILRFLSTWQPIPDTPINVPVNPDARHIPGGADAGAGERPAIRDGAGAPGAARRSVAGDSDGCGECRRGCGGSRCAMFCLHVQIAICAVLVTSSLVAVRGLARSMHSNFGFVPQNVMLAGTELHMSGYTDERMPQMQRRMLDAAASHSRCDGCGLHRPLAAGLVWRRLVCLHR